MASPLPIEPVAAAECQARDQFANVEQPQVRQRVYGPEARTDPTVTWVEFRHWAKLDRAEECESERRYRDSQGPWTLSKFLKGRFSKGQHAQSHDVTTDNNSISTSNEEKSVATPPTDSASGTVEVIEEEWKTASRALRTAGWGAIFFLVTTDILGWSAAPYVFSAVGYGPGVGLYLVFGIAAATSGYMIWKVFVTLDSARFPIYSYGDLFLRVFGPKTRHFINITQSLQQFCSVMVLILGNGTIISQLAGPGLCFIVCMIISLVIGMVGGSIRSLQRLGWLCNFSVVLNIVSFIIIMVASAKFGIDYSAAFGSTILPKEKLPVKTFVGIPLDAYQNQATGFSGTFNGIDSMVYAYSGAVLFVAFMAEMRHPMDFWKGMILAQAFICFVYILFGAYVYSNYGQYAISNINNVIQPYSLQTVGNVMSLLTGLIACVLYFNVGMKTVYLEVCQELLHFPSITSKKGRFLWYGLGPVYWIVAFVLAAAVPNLTGIVNFIGGLLSVNFTYAFPGMVYLGWSIQEGALLPGEEFDAISGETAYQDNGVKRWTRGFLKRWYVNIPCLAYVLASLACSGMGTWAAVEGLIGIFGPGGTVATSFGCQSPVWG